VVQAMVFVVIMNAAVNLAIVVQPKNIVDMVANHIMVTVVMKMVMRLLNPIKDVVLNTVIVVMMNAVVKRVTVVKQRNTVEKDVKHSLADIVMMMKMMVFQISQLIFNMYYNFLEL